MDPLQRLAECEAEEREAEREVERVQREAAKVLERVRMKTFDAHRALIFSIIAEDDGISWAARISEVIRDRGREMAVSDIQQFLDGGVRQKKLVEVASGYQLIRPGVLKILTHPLRPRA